MRSNRLIPIAVLAFVAACSDTATSPNSLTSAGGPLAFQVEPDAYPGTLNTANVPGGTHLSNNSGPISCTVDDDLSISCGSYQLGGVGNTNVTVTLDASYTAIIDCNNPGNNRNNPIESHEADLNPTSTVTVPSTRNGRLTVPQQSVDFEGEPIGCPNDNWEPEIREGSVVLESFSYSVTFAGFSSPAVSIAAP